LFALHVLPYANYILCVEPTPEHMVIQKQLLTSSLVGHEQSALNSYTGKCRFRKEPVNTTMNTIRDSSDAYEVDCITLRGLCDKYLLTHVDLVKIDIEGSEVAAITPQTVSDVSHIVKKFLLETHPRSRQMQDHFKKIFEECGYKAEYVDFNGSILAYK
jgi:FkbM family methyltransferase